MSPTTEVKPGKHSQRVAAWIYTVLNPLIEAMRTETHLLEKGNLSWRCHMRRFEHIRPIGEYIDAHYLPNFEDFLADNKQFADRFKSHDDVLARAEATANRFYDILIISTIFNAQVNQSFEQYNAKVDTSHPYSPSLDSMKDDLGKYVAENLVNNVDSLPTHYTIHKFWEMFGKKLREAMSDFDPYKERQSFDDLKQSIEKMRETAISLQQELESYRLRLCREFDLPAAQPMPPRNPAENLFLS